MLKFIYFVPESHLEKTKQAIFLAKAGESEKYEHCVWQVKGLGQFKAKQGAEPFLGQIDQLEYVEEWRVETIVREENARHVLNALLDTHPYEEPAFEFIKLYELNIEK